MSHRGAFGDYGGEERGLIDRSFRERIVLVGVIRDGQTEEDVDEALDELALLVDTAGADEVARVTQKRHARWFPAAATGRSAQSPCPPD